MNQDRNDIAAGLYLDGSSLEDYLLATDQRFLTNAGDRYIFVQATPHSPDNGPNFACQRDIPKIDCKVAQDTFTFYNHLLSAEPGPEPDLRDPAAGGCGRTHFPGAEAAADPDPARRPELNI
jgi:hypothetical protein